MSCDIQYSTYILTTISLKVLQTSKKKYKNVDFDFKISKNIKN